MSTSISSARAAVLALAACCATTAAMATATGTVTVGQVSWTLIDLNTTDGITPSFSFAYTGSQSNVIPVGGGNSAYDYMNGSYQPTSASVSNVYGSLSASTGATGATASAVVYGSTATGTNDFGYSYAYPLYGGFTLSPNTLIVLTLPYTATATTSVGYLNGYSEYVQSYGVLAAFFNGSSNNQNSYQGQAGVYAGSQYDPVTQTNTGQTASSSGTVELIFANRTALPVDGYLQVYGWIYASSSIAAVPENSAATLLSGGLAALGLLMQRRRRDRAAA